jgi:hypothetical protein
MIMREDLYNKLLYLVTDAKFSFWPDERESEEETLDDKGYGIENVKLIDKWIIHWNVENQNPLPSLEEINNLSIETVNAQLAIKAKEMRNAEMSKNLSIISNYQTYAGSNPGVSFSDYLDMLETITLA